METELLNLMAAFAKRYKLRKVYARESRTPEQCGLPMSMHYYWIRNRKMEFWVCGREILIHGFGPKKEVRKDFDLIQDAFEFYFTERVSDTVVIKPSHDCTTLEVYDGDICVTDETLVHIAKDVLTHKMPASTVLDYLTDKLVCV